MVAHSRDTMVRLADGTPCANDVQRSDLQPSGVTYGIRQETLLYSISGLMCVFGLACAAPFSVIYSIGLIPRQSGVPPPLPLMPQVRGSYLSYDQQKQHTKYNRVSDGFLSIRRARDLMIS